MTERQFLNALKKTTSDHKWVTWSTGAIRTSKDYFCPITAVCAVLTGTDYPESAFRVAAHKIKLSLKTALDIVMAADLGSPDYIRPRHTKLRKQMIQILKPKKL